MTKFIDIEQLLKEKGIEFKLINLPEVAISMADVIRLSGGQIKKEEIVKTLIVKNKAGNFIACLLKGGDRLKKEVIDKLASPDQVLQIAGVEIGAVCPILLGIPILIDKKVSKLTRVNMGSGDHLKGLEMNFGDLLKILPEYTIEEISI